MACSHATCGECVKAGCGWNGSCVAASEPGASTQCAVYANTFVTPKPSEDSLDNVGSVGFVDMDNRSMKTVDPKDVKWGGEYTISTTTARRSDMKSCMPVVKYGDIVELTSNEGDAIVGKFGVVKVHQGQASKFLVRPEKGVDAKDGTPVKYGESIVLTTSTATKDETCGVYGCGVGQILDGKFIMGEGGVNGGTALKLSWNKVGEVRYGDPFQLMIEEKFAAVSGTGELVFEKKGSQFGFGPKKTCDVKSLQGMCGTECAGILLSDSSNEWQMLMPGSVYEKSNTIQTVYLKTPKLMLEDASCQGGVTPIETSAFSNFQITGQLRSDGKNQCTPTDMSDLNALMKSALPKKEAFTMDRKTQQGDWNILEKQNMARTAMWAVLLVAIVAMAWRARR
jgi:hypothetical protein